VLVLEARGGLLEFGDELDHVGRDMDGLDGVDEGALDGLLDPPRGVGGKARALRGVEAFDGADEADVSLFNQVGEGEAAVGVVFGDGDDEAQVRAHERFARFGA